jgi:hypothetical protein
VHQAEYEQVDTCHLGQYTYCLLIVPTLIMQTG